MSDDDKKEGVPEYKVGKKVALDELINQDQGDESLRKYKESLLGKLDASVAPKDDPRRVVIKELRVIFENRPGGDIIYNFESKADLDNLKKTPFVLKESSNYKIKISFKVQHDIVSGLKYQNAVYRKGIRVAKDSQMIGSFGPQAALHEVTFPRIGWEETPSGMLSRGSYTAKSQYVDDDTVNHLEYEYAFDIKSDWK